jgi:spore coat protein CotH
MLRLFRFLVLPGFMALTLDLASAQPPRDKGGPPGGPMAEDRKLVKEFDKDGDKRLNREERQAAREFLKKERDAGGGRRMGGPPGGMGRRFSGEAPKPGPRVTPADVQSYNDEPLYDPKVLRTLFLEFEDSDWEAELADFYHTDVEVPATLFVDGKKYPNIGVRFRGASSYFGVPPGYKHSLNVSMDFVDKKQRLHGYKTLNLLNGNGDPSMMSSVLYSHIARPHLPTPKANFAVVAINGESWGVFSNLQQFNKEFLEENFPSSKGARWKVKGSPGGGGGLEYIGDNPDDYKRRYEIKSEDNKKSWTALIQLCKTLNETPADKLEAALKPMLDLDGLLWFLALDVTLMNMDGYWIRASDYSLFLDEKGVFHVIPHDMNESFRGGMGGGPGGPGGNMVARIGQPGEILPNFLQDALRLNDDQRKQIAELQKELNAKLEKILTAEQRTQLKNMNPAPMVGGPPGAGGPGGRPGGGRGGPGGAMPRFNGVELDPLVGLDDPRKPLRSKLLAVPSLKARYLQHVRTLAEESLDWKKLGPVVAQYRQLIEKAVEADTRKLSSFADFQRATADTAAAERGQPGRIGSLRAFADERRKYLLSLPAPRTSSE